MNTCRVAKAVVYQSSAAILMARLVNESGANVTKEAIQTIECYVFDTSSPTAPVVVPSYVIKDDAIFDTLQLNPLWDEDDVGFNFRHVLQGPQLPLGNRTYAVEYRITPVGGTTYVVVFSLETVKVYSSGHMIPPPIFVEPAEEIVIFD